MDYELQVVLERVITFGSIFGILFIFLRNQHKQRMLMIEKGVFEVKKNDFNTKRGLMMAILLLFAVMGTIAGWILFNTIALFEGSPIFVVLPFGFVAVGYLVYYYYFVFKQEKKQD